MKELFDELRDALPAERGGKSSKWEVLTKSIEYLGQIRQQHTNLVQSNNDLTQENQSLNSMNENLNRELERLRAELGQRNPMPSSNNHYHPSVNGGGGGYSDNVPHYNGGSHQSHQNYQQHPQGSAPHPMQSRPAASDGNQMQGIERSSNY